MNKATKNLPAVGDLIQLRNPGDGYYVSFQYISGAGTVVVEGSNDGQVWFALLLDSATTAATQAASFTAAGGWVGVCPFEFVQARKTVGVLDCLVSLGLV